MPTATFDRYDIVVVPFPFTDKAASKRRPALVLSIASTFNRAASHSVMAMITSAVNAPWPQDTPIADLTACGLSAPSVGTDEIIYPGSSLRAAHKRPAGGERPAQL